MTAIKNEKAFKVFDTETKAILYEGNVPFKALQVLHVWSGRNIQFSNTTQAAIFNYVLAMSERLN